MRLMSFRNNSYFAGRYMCYFVRLVAGRYVIFREGSELHTLCFTFMKHVTKHVMKIISISRLYNLYSTLS
jgi:hypothetical protein